MHGCAWVPWDPSHALTEFKTAKKNFIYFFFSHVDTCTAFPSAGEVEADQKLLFVSIYTWSKRALVAAGDSKFLLDGNRRNSILPSAGQAVL